MLGKEARVSVKAPLIPQLHVTTSGFPVSPASLLSNSTASPSVYYLHIGLNVSQKHKL